MKKIESKEPKDGETKKLEQKPITSITCRNCGRNYLHTGARLAKGKTCNNCGKPNHFANVCRGKKSKTNTGNEKSNI